MRNRIALIGQCDFSQAGRSKYAWNNSTRAALVERAYAHLER